MTHDPSISGAQRPIDPASGGAPSSKISQASGAQTTQGAAFKALLEKLENKTRDLQEATDALTDPAQLADAVDHARTSLDDAVSLGDQLLEAYRAARHAQGESEAS